MEATLVAQDIQAAWLTASPEQRRRIVWSMFEIIHERSGGMIERPL